MSRRIIKKNENKIDKAEDEEAEFVFAESQNVSGREETESGKNDWNKYKKYDVMDRADLYAKSNNIKRTTTFLKKVKQEKKRKATENAVNLAKIYEDKLEEEKEENETQTTIEEENVEIYVPSKLNKVENKMAESIELGKKEKTEKKEEEQNKKEIETEQETEEQKEEDNKAEYVAADNKKNENENDKEELIETERTRTDTSHGYTETVVVNVVEDQSQKNEEEEDEENKPLNPTDDSIQGNNSGYKD